MRYLSDPLFWLYSLIGFALLTGYAILMVNFGLNKPAQNPWEAKRIVFICVFLTALFGCAYLVGQQPQYQAALGCGLIAGLITSFWILLASNSVFFNPFRWRAWKVALIRALAAEGKTPRDLAIALMQVMVLFIVIATCLFIRHEIRVFNR